MVVNAVEMGASVMGVYEQAWKEYWQGGGSGLRTTSWLLKHPVRRWLPARRRAVY